LCQKTEEQFWKATLREVTVAIQAAMDFQEEYTLPLMAVHATWTAYQQRVDKMVSIEKLLNVKDAKDAATDGPMSSQEMISNLMYVHKKALEIKAKNEQEDTTP